MVKRSGVLHININVSLNVYFQKSKPKKTDVNFKKPEGMHRELWGLLWTDNKYVINWKIEF